ncbi:MAG: LysR family transcriptional regulator [Archangium sp.]
MKPELRSDRLAIFDAVVRHGGFSAAARALGLPQSSVSQHLAALEEDVGEALVDRSSRKLRLTEAGQSLALHARTVLDALDASRAALKHLGSVTGSLSLGASDTLATHLLPPVFAAFRRAHADVELRLDNRPSPTLAERVAARELDLAVVTLPLPPGSPQVARLKQMPLVPQHDVVIAPPKHELASKQRVKLSELAKHPLVLLDRTTGSRAWLERHFAAEQLVPRVVMEMSSLEVLKRLVSLEFGVSVVPELAVRNEVAAKALVARPLVGAERRMVGLLLPPSPSRAALAFSELARTTLG